MRTAYIGMGANLPSSAGSPEATLAAAVVSLESLGSVVNRSSLYLTEPVGFAGQPRFVNAVVGLETELSPQALLEEMLDIEQDFGRNRAAGIVNGPRTLDLDILLFDDFVMGGASLEIPHPRLAERGFVLVPLHEIAPAAIDPRSGNTVAEMLKNLFPIPEEAIHAVAPLESDVWHAGTSVDSASSQRPKSHADQ